MDERRRRAQVQTYDLGVGFFGFFAVAFFAISVFLQVTGRDAVWASFPALLSFVVLGVIWFFRKRFLSRTREED